MNPIAKIKHLVGPKLRPYRKIHRDYAAKFNGELRQLDTLLSAAESGAIDLVPDSVELQSKGSALSNRYLARVLSKDRLGEWALDRHSIEFLWQQFTVHHPRCVLEFGSGLSTIVFCRFLDELGTGNGIQVYSIEQNQWQIDLLQARLAELGMSDRVKLLHAPTRYQCVDGRTGEFYHMPPQTVTDFLGESKPDFVIIDGPAGDDWTRFGTLPYVREFVADGARFFLDDALRLNELRVANEWSRLPYIELIGVYAVGKGIATGIIHTGVS